jgi:hypothetical protein
MNGWPKNIGIFSKKEFFMDKNGLLGRWNILSWEQRYDDGRVTHPLGTALEGFIQYDPNGQMMCMMARADRAPFVTGGQWNAQAEERASAYSGFMAYAGTYSVDGEWVTHHVETTLFPNWKNGNQKRRVQLQRDPSGDRLDITARLEEGTPEARTAVLAWKRFSHPFGEKLDADRTEPNISGTSPSTVPG